MYFQSAVKALVMTEADKSTHQMMTSATFQQTVRMTYQPSTTRRVLEQMLDGATTLTSPVWDTLSMGSAS